MGQLEVNQQRYQHQKAERHFDSEYKSYQKYHLENWRISYLNRIFRSLSLDCVNDTEDERVLDIGVGGSGYTVIEVARKNIRSIGIDFSFEGIKKARQLSRQVLDNKNVTLSSFLVASAESLPFNDHTFTKVISIAVLEHVPDDQMAFDEIARVTKEGGQIFIMVPNTYERTPFLYKILGRINDRHVGHLRHYKAEEMIAEFKKKGFVFNDLIYHAHNIKILQWILTIFLPPLRRTNSKWWWRLEDIDLRQKNNGHASVFSVVMTKEKAQPHKTNTVGDNVTRGDYIV